MTGPSSLSGHLVPHSPVRIPGEPVLKRPGYRVADLCQRASRARDRFGLIPDGASLLIEREEEALFAFFDVVFRCLVDEPKGVSGLYDFDNTAQVQRPESEALDLNRNDLGRCDPGQGIGYSHPAQVEMLPFLKRLSGEFESCDVATDL